jgi:hypothetical protein
MTQWLKDHQSDSIVARGEFSDHPLVLVIPMLVIPMLVIPMLVIPMLVILLNFTSVGLPSNLQDNRTSKLFAPRSSN